MGKHTINVTQSQKKILLALSEDDFSFPTVSTAPVKRLNSVAEHLELEYDESSFPRKLNSPVDKTC